MPELEYFKDGLLTSIAISSLDNQRPNQDPNCPCDALKHTPCGQERPALKMTALTLCRPTQPRPYRRPSPLQSTPQMDLGLISYHRKHRL